MNSPTKPTSPPRGKGTGPDPSDDLTIPVLTERVSVPPRTVKPMPAFTLDTELPTGPLAASFSGRQRVTTPEIPPPPGAVASGRLEIELRESILHDLAHRLPQEVEAIVRRHMAGAIDAMVEKLSADTRVAVAASLREIVDHAVKAELERLKAKKK
jgi:hypothetical protein